METWRVEFYQNQRFYSSTGQLSSAVTTDRLHFDNHAEDSTADSGLPVRSPLKGIPTTIEQSTGSTGSAQLLIRGSRSPSPSAKPGGEHFGALRRAHLSKTSSSQCIFASLDSLILGSTLAPTSPLCLSTTSTSTSQRCHRSRSRGPTGGRGFTLAARW